MVLRSNSGLCSRYFALNISLQAVGWLASHITLWVSFPLHVKWGNNAYIFKTLRWLKGQWVKTAWHKMVAPFVKEFFFLMLSPVFTFSSPGRTDLCTLYCPRYLYIVLLACLPGGVVDNSLCVWFSLLSVPSPSGPIVTPSCSTNSLKSGMDFYDYLHY